ncbi:MAG TPA: ImmA/IrrE family metallo-endopeptidase [Terracidiphilus sp.]
MPPRSTKSALQRAQQLIDEKGIDALPVDPFAIARQSDILVYEKAASDAGVSGMLVKSGDSFGIAYATHIPSEGFKRFSVAHELGHYFLPAHCQELFGKGETTHYSQAGFRSGITIEREADEFACGLLMPEKLFLAAARGLDDGLAGVETLATVCKTSLVATAIRLVETAKTPVAVALSINGQFEFCFLSQAMQEFPQLDWPKKGAHVPSGTVTERISHDRNAVERGDRDEDESDLRDWFGGRRSATVLEEAVGLGRYGRILTMITCDTYADDSDEDEELRDRWTPRL